ASRGGGMPSGARAAPMFWVRSRSAATPAARSVRANPVIVAYSRSSTGRSSAAGRAPGRVPAGGGGGAAPARMRSRAARVAAAGSVNRSAGPDILQQPVAQHRLLVLPVLQQRAEGGGGEVGVEVPGAEGEQRLGPVEGLGDARRLDQ